MLSLKRIGDSQQFCAKPEEESTTTSTSSSTTTVSGLIPVIPVISGTGLGIGPGGGGGGDEAPETTKPAKIISHIYL